ncbi:MAG: hypothetical protein WCH31_09135 [Actinomycetes bacterium]
MTRRDNIIAGTVAIVAVAGVAAAFAATQYGSSNHRAPMMGVGAGPGGAGMPGLGGGADGSRQAPGLGGSGGDLGGGRYGGAPGGGFRDRPGGAFIGLDAAATYLGVSADSLRAELQGGKSLADVAKAKGKSVDGLVGAMVKAQQAQLDKAVAAGMLSKSQAQTLAGVLSKRVRDMVTGTGPGSMMGGPGGGFGDGGGGDDGFGDDDGGAPGGGTFGGSSSGGSGNFGGSNAAPQSSLG